MTRDDTLALDARDPLRGMRDQFELPAGLIYLDGNSLGALPRATLGRLQTVVQDEWGRQLIQSWNTAGWMALPQRVGDKIARLVGAGAGELVVADSTSVNLFKVLSAALAIARVDAPGRTRIVSERANFPTDLYIAEGLARQHGAELVLVEADGIDAALDERTAVLMLTQVNYRTGRLHDMEVVTRRAHAAGALTVWDLAHSAGALPVDLKGARADFAVGCGYKYLNGGPGAPAFVWVHPRHADRFWQPLSGWMGHVSPFDFSAAYRPAPGISRYLCGTPPVLSLAALECGVDTVLGASIDALREKSIALTQCFIELVETRCAGHALSLASPRDAQRRGSQVSFARDQGGYGIVQALIARGVVGDFRAGNPAHDDTPDILRFGFTPLYTRFVDAWDAVEHLRLVLESGEWTQPRFNRRAAVT